MGSGLSWPRIGMAIPRWVWPMSVNQQPEPQYGRRPLEIIQETQTAPQSEPKVSKNTPQKEEEVPPAQQSYYHLIVILCVENNTHIDS